MKLFLVRHANPKIDFAVPSDQWQLTAMGINRAGIMAKQLKGRSIQGVISSPEPKAFQTAQILAKELNIDVEVVDGLREHIRPWTTQTFSDTEFYSKIIEFFARPDALVFGVETANSCFARFNHALKQAISDRSDQSLAIVSHGTVLALFLSRYNNINPYLCWQCLSMPAYLEVELPDFKLRYTWILPK